MADSMTQRDTELFCKEVFGKLIATVEEYRSNRPDRTLSLYREVVLRCEQLIPFYRVLMSKLVLGEVTAEHGCHIEDFLEQTNLRGTQPTGVMPVDATRTNSINPAVLSLSNAFERELDLGEAVNDPNCTEASLSNDFSAVDERGGEEAEDCRSAVETTINMFEGARLTARTQNRAHVRKKTPTPKNKSALLHKRRRTIASKNSITRTSAHSETIQQLMNVTASPEAFQQLSRTFKLIRQKIAIHLPLDTRPLSETIPYMKSIEGFSPAEKLIRRFYICQLHKRRRELQKTLSQEVTLDRMLQEAYPDRPLPQHRAEDKKRKELKNQLGAAKNWVLMQETFGEASIALIPSQGRARIWNQRISYVPQAIFQTFLHGLKTKRGPVIDAMSAKLGSCLIPILQGVNRTTMFAFESLGEDELVSWLHDASKLECFFAVTNTSEEEVSSAQ